MRSNHDLVTSLDETSDHLAKLIALGTVNQLIQAFEDAWNDPPDRVSAAINHGAYDEYDDDEAAPAVEGETVPDLDDPTADEAMITNRARTQRRRFERIVTQIGRDVEALYDCWEQMRPPTKVELDDVAKAADDHLNPLQCVAHLTALGECVDLTTAELARQKRKRFKLCRTCLDKFAAIQTEPKIQPCSDDKALGVLIRLLKITPGTPTTLQVDRAAGLKPGTIRPPRDVPARIRERRAS